MKELEGLGAGSVEEMLEVSILRVTRSIGDRRSQWPLARGWLRRGWRIVLSGRKEV